MRRRTCNDPERYTFLYLDELTYYRQPTLAYGYEAMGESQPLAQRSYHRNTHFRVLGALNARTGQLSYRQRSQTDTACLANFWYQVREDYPDAQTIYIVVDNWPVHCL
jgi:hypothetical protein